MPLVLQIHTSLIHQNVCSTSAFTYVYFQTLNVTQSQNVTLTRGPEGMSIVRVNAPQTLQTPVGAVTFTPVAPGATLPGGTATEPRIIQGPDSIEKIFCSSSGLKNSLGFLFDSEMCSKYRGLRLIVPRSLQSKIERIRGIGPIEQLTESFYYKKAHSVWGLF